MAQSKEEEPGVVRRRRVELRARRRVRVCAGLAGPYAEEGRILLVLPVLSLFLVGLRLLVVWLVCSRGQSHRGTWAVLANE
jgi:hypothetical protein